MSIQAPFITVDPYVDVDGLAHMTKVDPISLRASDNNGVAYTSMWYILKYLHGELLEFETERFHTIMRARFRTWPSGILDRGSTSPDQEGQDDYLWLTTAGAILGVSWIAHNIYWQGRHTGRTPIYWWLRVRYFYNNARPGTALNERGEKNWSAWLGRYPAFVPHLFFARKVSPRLDQRLRWALALLWSARRPIADSDTWTQSWAMVQTFKVSGVKSWVCSWAARRWWGALKHQAPLGMATVAFPEHPLHPITLAWENFE